MLSVRYSFLENNFLNIFIFFTICYQLIKSLTYLGDYFTENPLFEKRQKKYSNTWNSDIIINSIFVFVLFYVFIDNSDSSVIKKHIIILYFMLFVLFKIIKKIENDSFENKITISTNNFFLVLYIPLLEVILKSEDLIDLLLPLEAIGMLTYFIFLEFTYKKNINKNKNLTINTITKSFLFVFWINFLGTFFLFLSIVVVCVYIPYPEYSTISFVDSQLNNIFLFLFVVGIFVKIGGIFFFFFKTELYKVLTPSSIIILSVYISFIYLIILYFILLKITTLQVFLINYFLPLTFFLTIFFFLLNGLNTQNTYFFLGLSSTLTIFYCILVLI